MSNDASSDAASVERIERQRLRALVEADMPTCEGLHADDYELITPRGGAITRADYLGAIGSGDMRYTVFEPADEVRVRQSGTVAIVRYKARIELRAGHERDSGLFWHTDTYELRNGRWQAVWSQATRISVADG